MRTHTEAEFRAVAGFALLVAAFTLAPASDSQWTRSFTSWYGANQSRATGSANSANLAWFESHLLQGTLAEYEATHDTVWLDRFTLHADAMFASMSDVPDSGRFWPGYRDRFLGWGTTRYDAAHHYQEYMVHDGFICLPVARFIRLVYSTPELRDRYLKPARRYQATIEKNIVAKWFRNWNARRGPGDDLKTYGGWRNLPLNMFLAFGELLLVFSDIRQSPSYVCAAPEVPGSFYTAVPDSMAHVFMASLHGDPATAAWTWSYWPVTVADTLPEDLSHANLDISFALEASRHGIVFTPGDMKRFANTFTRLVWNGSSALPRFSSHVNGLGRDSLLYLTDWVRLTEYDTTIYGLVARAFGAGPRDPVTMGAGMAQTTAYLARTEAELPTEFSQRPGPTANETVSGTDFNLRMSPNPLIARGTFSYETVTAGSVGLIVYDESGRMARVVIHEQQSAGHHEATWDGTNEQGEPVPSGVYHCVLATTTSRETAVVVVLR